MGVPNNYEINVALKNSPEAKYGVHWCKIQLPDMLEENAVKKFETLRSMFGDHFHVSMTYWECKGTTKAEWE